jgi:putative membrane protein
VTNLCPACDLTAARRDDVSACRRATFAAARRESIWVMQAILIRLIVNAITLWVATALIDKIMISGGSNTEQAITLIVVAAIFGVVNAVVKPVVQLLALPLFILTLGLITFVINALMLLLTSAIAGWLDVPFRVDGFLAALLGSLVISIVSFLINVILPKELETR